MMLVLRVNALLHAHLPQRNESTLKWNGCLVQKAVHPIDKILYKNQRIKKKLYNTSTLFRIPHLLNKIRSHHSLTLNFHFTAFFKGKTVFAIFKCFIDSRRTVNPTRFAV